MKSIHVAADGTLIFNMTAEEELAEENRTITAVITIDDGKEEPTPEPTGEPTPEPTEEPTPEPTEEPMPEPTEEPTPEPTEEPTPEPTEEPTGEPTPEPTEEPTGKPTEKPQRLLRRNRMFPEHPEAPRDLLIQPRRGTAPIWRCRRR